MLSETETDSLIPETETDSTIFRDRHGLSAVQGKKKKSGSLLSDTDRFTDVGHKKPSVI